MRRDSSGSWIVAGWAIAVAAGLIVMPAGADQPTLDDLLELGSPEEQREALRDAAAEPDDEDEAGDDDAGASLLDESLRRMLDGGDPADVFQQAVREMGAVADRLGGEFDPGIETQRMQQSILDKLDQVIAAAQQQQSDASDDGGGSDGQSSAQQQDTGGADPAQQQPDAGDTDAQSAEAGDQPSDGDASPGDVQEAQTPEQALRELRQEWGNLPPRLRDEIAEGMNERFSPVYRSLTESYYRRLAEEE